MKQTTTWIVMTILLLVVGGCTITRSLTYEQVDQEAVETKEGHWISSAITKEGKKLRFLKEVPTLREQFNKPETYYGPVIAGDTLHGYLVTFDRVAIPLDQIVEFKVKEPDEGSTGVVILVLAGVVAAIIAFDKGMSGLGGVFGE